MFRSLLKHIDWHNDIQFCRVLRLGVSLKFIYKLTAETHISREFRLFVMLLQILNLILCVFFNLSNGFFYFVCNCINLFVACNGQEWATRLSCVNIKANRYNLLCSTVK